MELFLLYLWLQINTVLNLFLAGGVISFIAWAISWIIQEDNCDTSPEDSPPYQKFRKLCLLVLIPCLLFRVFLPDREGIAILTGGYFAVQIAKSPEASKVVTLLRGKANEMLDEQINKLKPAAAASQSK